MPKARKNTRGHYPAQPSGTACAGVATDRLLADVRALIEAAREQTARAVNSALVGLYWHIGTRIRQDILQEKRAEYGEQIVDALSTQLIGRVWSGVRPSKPLPDDPVRRVVSRTSKLSRRCRHNWAGATSSS